MDEKEVVKDYKTIREDYTFNPDIFNDEPERIARVKYIINHRLNQVDRTLIILYADCQSYRKLGKRLGISRSTCYTLVKKIRDKILQEYEHLH